MARSRKRRRSRVRRPRPRRNPSNTTMLLVGGGALALYLLWRSSQARPIATTTRPAITGGIGGAIGGFLSGLFKPITGLLTPGVEAAAGQGGYVFSEANGIILKTTTAPPWIKGQVSGWSCWDKKTGKQIPIGDPRCSAQIEAFTVLEGDNTDLGSLGGGW